jgi:glucan phosphoethanolaminetransferase (alkaline phosphatase superfamily)
MTQLLTELLVPIFLMGLIAVVIPSAFYLLVRADAPRARRSFLAWLISFIAMVHIGAIALYASDAAWERSYADKLEEELRWEREHRR